jgi:tRNA threonylcarbamoyl adenosine modification protein (Sua5/YciO/YrdC/YwlC family)/tRNA threonylcarbamoyl adenosine modification protein YjeE
MTILSLKKDGLEVCARKAEEVLESNGLVIYPTDTIYGAGVNALSQRAVEKLLLYKGQGFNSPIPIVVYDQKMAEQYVELNLQARNIYKNFLPGALTVISKELGKVDRALVSSKNTLGVRWIDVPFVNKLLSSFGKPITTTNAATDGKKWYTIENYLRYTPQNRLNLVDLIIDAGELPKKLPSTVVDTTLDQYVLVRKGEFEFPVVREFFSSSTEQTRNLGALLGEKLKNRYQATKIVIGLTGDLGAGKTHFTAGVASGLGVLDQVKSPTYVLEYRYRYAQGELRHLDVWRIEDVAEVEMLGLFEGDGQQIYVIEWAERIASFIKKNQESFQTVWVEIVYGASENERKITINSKDDLGL